MRRTFLPLLLTILILAARDGYAQSPPGINYQGVARNPDGKPLAQKDITIRINILKDGGNGDVEYAEVHSVQTNSFGLFTLVIGNGSVEKGNFEFITWSLGNKWLRVEMDPDGGNSFQLMGSQQFMSVPYAFYAKYTDSPLAAGHGISIAGGVIQNTGDADANPTNEANQSLTLGPDHILRITDVGGVKEADLSSLIAGAPQNLQLVSNKLKITDNPSATEIDLAPYLDNTDAQNLSLTGTTLGISNGTGVNLAPFRQDLSSTVAGTTRTISITNGAATTIDIADNDNNATNEIQDLTKTGNTLSLSLDATPVDLSSYLDNTDSQQLTLTGSQLTITGGNTVNLAAFMDDTDDQDLALNSATHSLSLTGDPTPVNLSAYLDNTDAQSLSLLQTGNTRTINISSGTGVSFSVADADSDVTNELQSLTYNTATKNLAISSGNSVTIPETQNLNQVLLQGNDANGQRITNLASPTALTDAATKQYVDNADASINTRISANYAFRTNFSYSSLLAGSNVTIPLADGTGSFDDFNVVNTSNFTAAVAGTYVFTVDGDISSILIGSAINLLYNGTKYPVSVGSNNRYNTTLMFRLTAGQTISLVADGLGIGTNINGSFMGYKLP